MTNQKADAWNHFAEHWLNAVFSLCTLQLSWALQFKSKNFVEATDRDCSQVAPTGTEGRRHDSEEAAVPASHSAEVGQLQSGVDRGLGELSVVPTKAQKWLKTRAKHHSKTSQILTGRQEKSLLPWKQRRASLPGLTERMKRTTWPSSWAPERIRRG